ncbi:MOSC domain-containing protein [Dyadobacter bucti]|uniref:MOSC domain-containing protein n=1 Tax=Dyadobacter bucti TaxID=2572203 RepID=UPI003F6E61C3
MPIRLAEIWIYPVKSLGGVRLKTSSVEEKGLQYDRRWMIVDKNGVFLTQRANPKMATLDVMLHDNGLILSNRFEPGDQVLVPFFPVSESPVQVKIWNDTVWARKVSDEADQWLSRQLGKNVGIVTMSVHTHREMNHADAAPGRTVSFADDFPYLMISQASLDDLNSRLAEPVAMRRFRPNFIISGTDPFAEDSWKQIKIGNVGFEIKKPCERCVVVNIDQHSGKKGTEPLKTLATYRRQNKKVLFGQNVISIANGVLREGDEVVVL